jgi:hypothetical protein
MDILLVLSMGLRSWRRGNDVSRIAVSPAENEPWIADGAMLNYKPRQKMKFRKKRTAQAPKTWAEL